MKFLLLLKVLLFSVLTSTLAKASISDAFNHLHEDHYCTVDINCQLQSMAVSQDALTDAVYNEVLSLQLVDSTMDGREFAWVMWDAYEPSKGIAHFSQQINKPDAYLEYRNPLEYDDTVPNVNDWLFDAYLNRPDNPSALNKFVVFNRHNTVVLPLWDDYVDKPVEHLKGMSAVYNKVNCFFGFDNCKERRIYQISGYAAFDVVGKQKVKVGKQWQYTVKLQYKGLRHCFNRAPTAEDHYLTTPEDTSLSITVDAKDPDDDAILIDIVTSTQNGTIIPSDNGTFTYTPNKNFNGSDQFVVSITDGLETIEKTIYIDITPVNDAPDAKPQTLQMLEDTSQEILLYGNDVDGDDLTFDINTQPKHGSLTVVNNQVIYTPHTNFTGQDSFVYVVSDGDLTSMATIEIEVLPVNDAPVATPNSYEILEDNTLELSLKGYDVDSDSLDFGITKTTKNGELTISGTRVTYVPNENFYGQDEFEFVVSDGELNDTAIITITVKPVNDAPNALPQTVTTDEDVAIDVTLEGTDPDSDTLSYSIVTQPSNGSVVIVDNVATYTPNPDFNGDEQFFFKVSDGELEATAVVKVVVTPVDDAPEAISQKLKTKEDTSLDIQLNAKDNDSESLTYKIYSETKNGSLTLVDSNVTYIPNNGFIGLDQFVFSVSDGVTSNLGTIDIEVEPDPNKSSLNIISEPVVSVKEGDKYNYQVIARTDNGSDDVSYSLADNNYGITIDKQSGLIDWNNTTQLVQPNTAPVLCEIPDAEASAIKPIVKWEWKGNSLLPNYASSSQSPIVAPVLDTNDDGVINQYDKSAIIFVTHSGNAHGNGILNVLDGETGKEIWTTASKLSELRLSPEVHSSMGDIDGDGYIEIVTGTNRGGVAVFEHDGKLKWSVMNGVGVDSIHGTTAISDLDTDGKPEVIRSGNVYSSTGDFLYNINDSRSHFAIADLDGDGKQEVINSSGIYNSKGEKLVNSLGGIDFAVADFNLDSKPDILTQAGLKDSSGNLIWRFEGGISLTSLPVIEDYNGDGYPDISALVGTNYQTFNHEGKLVWSIPVTPDAVPHGGSVLDLNNDGWKEIIFRDLNFIYFIDARTGQIIEKLDYKNSRSSWVEGSFPVIADIDKDLSAEIILARYGANNSGLVVFEDESNPWSNTRTTWSQHSYSINHIRDNGEIPKTFVPNWETHNSFRTNRSYGIADLGVVNFKLEGNKISAELFNRGQSEVPNEIVVNFYADKNKAILLGSEKLDKIGELTTVPLSINVDPSQLTTLVVAEVIVADEQEECSKLNNTSHAIVIEVNAQNKSGASDSQKYLLNVEHNINASPTFQNTINNYRLNKNVLFNEQLIAIDEDQGDILSYRLIKSPLGFAVNPRTGAISWIPKYGQEGEHRVIIQVSDVDGATDQFELVIDVVNRVPTSDDATISAQEDKVITIQPNLQDEDGDPVTFKIVENVENGSLIWRNNKWYYQPNENYYGIDSFKYTLSDGVATSRVIKNTINIESINDAPTVTPFTVKTLGDTITFDISQDADGNARGNDIEDGSNLTYHLGSVQNGTATQNGNIVTFTPKAGFDGVARVQYYAKDTEGLRGTAQYISVNVERINDTPVAKPLNYTISEDRTTTVKFVATDEEMAPLTYSIVRQPSYGVLEGEGDSWVYKPNPNYHGTDTFVYGASDGNSMGTAEVTIVVRSVNDAPTTENQDIVIDEDTPISITLKGEDADGDKLVYQMTSLGRKGVLTGSLPQFIYTPKADITGTDRLSYRIYDGTTYAYGTINITINPVNDAPVPKDVAQTVAEDSSRTFYLYASDPESNAITYALKNQPKHGTAELIGSNRVRYTPEANYFGEDSFEFTASDSELSGTGVINMTVSPTPDRPIASDSLETVAKNRTSTLALKAEDVDGDTLTYSIVTAPKHGTISENGALPSYTPEADFEGEDSFVFRVSDGTYTDDATVTLNVTTLPNKPPVWQSVAPTKVEAKQPYEYTLVAYDPDSTAITYELTGSVPDGMTLNGNGLSWTPTTAQVGSHEVTLVANDAEGSSTNQVVAIEVLEISVAPTITSQPIMQTYAGKVYRHQVIATDANSTDTLTYKLTNAPKGMIIDARTGLIIWQAPPEGTYSNIKIEVSDGYWVASQTYTLSVLKAVPLEVTLNAPDAIDVNTEFTVTVNIAGGGSDAVVELTNDNVPVAVDGSGQATLIATTLGQHILQVKVTDGNEVSIATHYYIVKDASDITAPTITFTDTADPLYITKPTDILGNINDDTAVVWETVLYDSYDATTGTGNIVTQNQGTGSVNGVIATIDPTVLVNGAYTFVTKVTDSGGNTTEDAKNIVIDGNMKIGELAFTLQDAQISMPNLDIIVERSYDSRTAYKSGDFGHGWALGLQTIKMRESRPMHTGWQAYLKSSLISNVGTICLKPINSMSVPNVTITLPDGNVETFKPKIGCNQGIYYSDQDYIAGGNSFSLSFEAVGDTQSNFEIIDTSSISYGDGRWTTGDRVIDETQGGYVYPYLVPKKFRLTTIEGMQYEFSRTAFAGKIKLNKLTDPAGNTLDVDSTGITHSLGTKARFTRDSSNRITKVTLPDNRYWQYKYDDRGDLTTVIDPANTQNKYYYDDTHRLLKITDKNGVMLTGYEYDESGRLIAMLDAKGNRVAIIHQPDSNSQIITDARGFNTTYTYDDYGNVTREVDHYGNVTLRSYDTKYNKLSETDANGNTTAWTYDDKHNKLSETNALGQTSTYTYDSRGQLLSETDHLGRVVSSTAYNNVGQLTTLKDVAGNATTISYNSTGMTGLTDASGNTTRYTYTGDDISQMTDSVGTIRTYTYDANNRKTQEKVTYKRYDGNNASYTNSWRYDAKGRVTSETVSGITTYKTYGESDEVLTSRTGSDTTTYIYDSNKKLIQTIFPDGSSSHKTYDASGNVISEKDALGNVTTHEYDALNRKIKTILPNGAVTTTTYDPVGNVLTETDANGNITTYAYDALNRQISVTDSLGNTHLNTYDNLGRLAQSTDKLGRITKYIYNELGQRIQVIYADGSSTQTNYDVLGRKLSNTDELGQTTSYAYDASGRLTQITDSMGNTTQYTYDGLGNKTAQTDALGRTTQWTYDNYGRPYQHILPDGSYSIKGYDGKGRTSYVDDFNRKRQTYVYDAKDRIVQTNYADNTSDIIDYNALGQRLKTTRSELSGNQVSRYSYDNMGNLTQEVKPNGDVINYAYNNNGNKTVMTLVSGSTTTTSYGYDRLNRLTSTTDGTGTTTYNYNAVGSKVSESKPNGVTTSYAFNPKNQLTGMTHQKGDTVLATYAYTLDPMGKRVALTEKVYGDTPTTTTSTWDYDALGRLISETVNGSTTTHDYNAVSNRISQNKAGQIISYVYDDNDRLTSETGAKTASYTYDKQGNTLAQTVNGTVTNYTYNARNDLVQADDVSFGYDIDGIRNSKAKNGTVIDYITDKNRDYAQVILEKQNNNPVASYSYGDDLISQNVNGATSYFIYDGLGSTKALTNSTGTITDTYQYDAYGEVTNQTGNTDNLYLYTGEQFDRSLNQYYLRARYYNQGVGRFTQMDTHQGYQTNPITLNKYLYAGSNPVMHLDPSGRMFTASFNFSIMGTMNSIAVPSSTAFLVKASVGLLTAGVVGHTAIDSESTVARILSSGIAQQALKIERAIQHEKVKRRANGKPIKFYYSSRARIISISATGGTMATPKYSGRLGNGVPKPPGFYGTDIKPWNINYTQESLSALFYGGDKNRDVSWFLAFDGTTCIPVHNTPHECYIPSALNMFVPVKAITMGPNLMSPY